jgi:hypothetical protein
MGFLMKWLIFTVALAAGCSGSSSGSVGAGDGGGGGGPTIPEGGSPLANGSCSFTLGGAAYTLPGFASMNGTGNLRIACATSDVSLSLGIGNPTYKGPGEYTFSPKKLDGGLLRLTTSDALYDATTGTDVRTACIVELTKSPVTDDAPPGSPIGGTFSCSAVPHYAQAGTDKWAEKPDGTFDIRNGTFDLAVR